MIENKMSEILKLEQEHREQKLDYDLSTARYKNRERALNSGIAIIAEQARLNTLCLFYSALR